MAEIRRQIQDRKQLKNSTLRLWLWTMTKKNEGWTKWPTSWRFKRCRSVILRNLRPLYDGRLFLGYYKKKSNRGGKTAKFNPHNCIN